MQRGGDGVATGQVEVDLDGAAGPAGLRLADGLAGGEAAVRRLRLGQQTQVDQHLAGVDGEELWCEAVVGGHEGRRVLADEPAREGQRPVGLGVGLLDEGRALRHPSVGDAVEVDVVVGRVGLPVGQLLGDQAQELVLELVGRRHAHHQQVRPVLLGDVLQHRPVAGGPVEALLDVGLLAW